MHILFLHGCHPMSWSLPRSMTWRCGFLRTDPNHQQPVWFKSDQPRSFQIARTATYINMLSRRGLMVLSLAYYVMASADDTACALQKEIRKPQIRDNYVYFYVGPDTIRQPTVQWVQFDETSHSISQGQPYEGVFTLGYYLDVRAGRHGSEEVAHDFNAGVTPDNALGLATFSPDTPLPSELNFAVFGTLSVTIDSTTRVCSGMRIAQGHHGGTNNWWIAGTKCHHQNGLTCPCGHTNVTFSSGGTAYDFDVVFD